MCGIAGILLKEKNVSLDSVKRMTDVISHRGPDGEGLWINEQANIGLGHRRLSIIDLSENGKQPMHFLKGRYTITFNGEIYNYLELKEDLLKSGYAFYSNSDTEVLLALYDQKKEKCLEYLNGMFSFAIWDETEQVLFCARDRFGEKPFYYFIDNQQFVFASEIKQFWAYGIEKKMSREHFQMFLSHSEVIDDKTPERTFYENIKSLKAAHYLIVGREFTPKIEMYWNLDGIKLESKVLFNDAVFEFRELLFDSIKLRLRSDVPVGSSLSGGLDSSAIVYSVNSNYLLPGQDQYTFSARFKSYEKDEGEYIDELISQLNSIKRNNVFLSGEDFENDISQITYHQDEPFQTASIFAQYKVMELAKKNNVKVLLDGQGADELLGGYEPMYSYYLKQLFFNSPANYSSEKDAYNKMHGWKYKEVDYARTELFSQMVKRKIKQFTGSKQPVPANYFSCILNEYISGSKLQQLLRFADRNSMAHSVEVRLPFLDHRLVEFVFSLPNEFKLNDGWTKYILRKAFDGRLPDKITWRRNKVGFEAPQERYMEGSLFKNKAARGRQFAESLEILIPQQTDPWNLFIIGYYADL